MIGTIRHKGLRKLFEDDDPSGLNPEHVRKICQILAVMDAAEQVEQLDLPTFRLHQLRADLRGFWSMTVRSNWRIVFRFEDGRATDVDLVDYH